ncbi:MAG TPA: M15 family metallopeptidase [Candidatus Obscuribacterales bacterium]
MSRNPRHAHGQDDPLVREAKLIASELDRGNAGAALERLQEDLHRLQNYPEAQIKLAANVFRFDRKGQGVDLQAQKVEQDGYLFADIRAVLANQWQNRAGAESYPVGMLFLGERRQLAARSHGGYDSRHNHNYYAQRQHGDFQGASWRGLTPEATAALANAQRLASQYGVTIEISSAGRSYAEQARLYRQLRGIRPVAYPGTSNHESGEAIDVKNYAQAKPFLQAAGFVHGDGNGPIRNDPWHFRYMGGRNGMYA